MEKYQAFDFDSNPQWKEYAANIDKSVSANRLEYLKRRWYKANIDKKFDPDYDRLSFEEFKKQQEFAQSYEGSSQMKRTFYDVENGLKFMLLSSSFFLVTMSVKVGLLVSAMALVRQLGKKRHFREFILAFLKNEFFHNACYLTLFYFYEEVQSILILCPIMVHSWLGIVDYVVMRKLQLYDRIQRAVDITKENKQTLLRQKMTMEIAVLPVVLFYLLALDQGSFPLLVLYANFLRLKYILNDKSKEAWHYLDKKIEDRIKSTPLIIVYTKIQGLFRFLAKFERKKKK